MSNRTIIEINHDMWMKIADKPEQFALDLVNYLGSANQDGRDKLRRYGCAVLGMVHHSDDIRVSFNKLT